VRGVKEARASVPIASVTTRVLMICVRDALRAERYARDGGAKMRAQMCTCSGGITDIASNMFIHAHAHHHACRFARLFFYAFISPSPD